MENILASLTTEIVLAALIVAATAVVVHISTKLIRGVATRTGHELPSSSIFTNIMRAAIWLVGLGLMLSVCFGVDVTALIAALGVGGIAVSLGFSDTISNLIGGLQVSMLGIVSPGDNIAVGTLKGVVEDVTWRQTVVKAADGRTIIIPNSVINAQTLQKYPPVNQVRIPVSVATDGRNLDEVAAAIEKAALAAASSVGKVQKDPQLVFSEINEMAVNGALVYAMESDDNVTAATNAIIRAVAPYARNSYSELAAQSAPAQKQGPIQV